MNKETNKLLADFLGLELFHKRGNLYFSPGKYKKIIAWQPDLDWNQLMQVIDKLEFIYSPMLDELHFLAIQEVLSTTIGSHITWIYNKVVNIVKLLMNESSINPE